jgi:hypothetical protein
MANTGIVDENRDRSAPVSKHIRDLSHPCRGGNIAGQELGRIALSGQFLLPGTSNLIVRLDDDQPRPALSQGFRACEADAPPTPCDQGEFAVDPEACLIHS